jgi:hypothetical protein
MSARTRSSGHDWTAGRDAHGAESEDLVTEIANALATAGEYVAQIGLEPIQRAVDFNWTARQAGRRLGIRVNIESTFTKSSDGRAQVRVSAVRPPS